MSIYVSCNLPSSTIHEIELKALVFDLSDLQPLKQSMLLRSSAKLISVRIYVIMSAYASFFFSASFVAICFIVFVADGPAPPVHEKIRGEKLLCSTSRIRGSYFRFFCCS